MSLLRAFIAVQFPDSSTAELGHAVSRLKSRCLQAGMHVSWVPQENLHITLRFLGTTEEQDLAALAAALQDALAAVPPLRLGLQSLGAMPSGPRPRLFYAGVDEPAVLVALVARITTILQLLGIPPEARPFVPHMTVGRIRDPRGVRALSDLLRPFVAQRFGEPAQIPEVILMESQLRYGPPIYIPRHRIQLRGDAAI